MIVLKMILMGTLICFACLVIGLIFLSVRRSLVNWWNDDRSLKQQWTKIKERWNEYPLWRSVICVAVVIAYGYSVMYHLKFILG